MLSNLTRKRYCALYKSSKLCIFPYYCNHCIIIDPYIFLQKTKENIILKSNNYIKFVDISFKTIKSFRMNIYSCKYSKHVYIQYQFLVLALLKGYISTDYRDFVEHIDRINDLKKNLILIRLPISLPIKSLYPGFPLLCLTFFCQKL